MDLTQWHSDI